MSRQLSFGQRNRPPSQAPASSPATSISAYDTVSHNGKNISTPRLIADTADANSKRKFFNNTKKAFQGAGSNVPNISRATMFADRFSTGQAQLALARSELESMYDYNNQLIKVENAQVFVFDSIKFFGWPDAKIAPIKLSPPWDEKEKAEEALKHEEKFRTQLEHCEIMSFRITIRPATIAPSCKMPQGNLTGSFLIPLELREDHELFGWRLSREICSDVRKVWSAILDATGNPPNMGSLKSEGGGIYADVDQSKFQDQFEQYYYGCVFDLLVQSMRGSYLGVVDQDTAQTDLLRCRQNGIDPMTGVPRALTVQEYYTEFVNMAISFPDAAAFPLDLADLFYMNASTEIKTMAESEGPPPPDYLHLRRDQSNLPPTA